MAMTSKQRAYLKGLASNITPIFQVGKASLTPEIVMAVDEALEKQRPGEKLVILATYTSLLKLTKIFKGMRG